MVRKREHGNAFGMRAIHCGKRKIFDKDAPRVSDGRRTGEREGKGPDHRLFDRGRKTRAEAGLFLVVVDYLCQKFTPRGGNESGTFHRDVRRASANTSSAA